MAVRAFQFDEKRRNLAPALGSSNRNWVAHKPKIATGIITKIITIIAAPVASPQMAATAKNIPSVNQCHARFMNMVVIGATSARTD